MIMAQSAPEHIKKVIKAHGYHPLASMAIWLSSMCSPLLTTNLQWRIPWTIWRRGPTRCTRASLILVPVTGTARLSGYLGALSQSSHSKTRCSARRAIVLYMYVNFERVGCNPQLDALQARANDSKRASRSNRRWQRNGQPFWRAIGPSSRLIS